MTPNGISVDGYCVAIPVDFRIALSRIRFSYHLLLRLQASTNHESRVTGIGEGVLYRTLPHQVADLFQPLARESRIQIDADPVERDGWIAGLARVSPALAYAMDTSLWDLRGKQAGKSVAALLGGPYRRHVPITEQVFIQDWNATEAELDAILSRGTRQLKIKIGTSPQADLETVRRIRAFAGPEIEIRVDANRAYTLADGEPLYRALADLGVLALEEPLSTRDWHSLRTLRQRVGLPVILDERVLSLDDLQAAIAREAIDVLNVKLTRIGGISQALRYAEVCRQHGVEVALGCTEDLGVGTAAIVHLAAALPEVHSTEGVGPLRLGFDLITEQWTVRDGTLTLPDGPGLGVMLLPDWSEQLPRQVRCFDLSRGGWQLSVFSHSARWFQRANNVLWRAQRRIRR